MADENVEEKAAKKPASKLPPSLEEKPKNKGGRPRIHPEYIKNVKRNKKGRPSKEEIREFLKRPIESLTPEEKYQRAVWEATRPGESKRRVYRKVSSLLRDPEKKNKSPGKYTCLIYTEAVQAEMEDLASKGWSNLEIATKFDVGMGAFYRELDNNLEFALRMKKARSRHAELIEQTLYSKAIQNRSEPSLMFMYKHHHKNIYYPAHLNVTAEQEDERVKQIQQILNNMSQNEITKLIASLQPAPASTSSLEESTSPVSSSAPSLGDD